MITKKELAKKLKVSVTTIDRRVEKGMPHYKIGRLIRFDFEEVKQWIKGGN